MRGKRKGSEERESVVSADAQVKGKKKKEAWAIACPGAGKKNGKGILPTRSARKKNQKENGNVLRGSIWKYNTRKKRGRQRWPGRKCRS